VFPTTTVALSLIAGFSFMLLVEPVIHRVSERSGRASHHTPLPTTDPSRPTNDDASPTPRNVVFDVELGNLERSEGVPATASQITSTTSSAAAYPLTLGLMVHALADGFALGSSAFDPTNSSMSVIVFLALIVHKGESELKLASMDATTCSNSFFFFFFSPAPAVLALSTSLLATSLPHSECRKHIAVFSASTPIGAVVSYGILSLFRVGREGNWTGVLMLISV
jgi:solute carrier family 39 (zinc transporter), member 9